MVMFVSLMFAGRTSWEDIYGNVCISDVCRQDILVFMTGQEEIESMVKTIRDASKELPQGEV